MRSYIEIDATLDKVARPNKRDFIKAWGYRKGECIGTFPSKQAAAAAGAVTTEEVLDEEGLAAAWLAYNQRESQALEIWQKELFDQFPDVKEEVKQILYGAAYEDAHSGGHDEVGYKFGDYVDLFEKVKKVL